MPLALQRLPLHQCLITYLIGMLIVYHHLPILSIGKYKKANKTNYFLMLAIVKLTILL